MQGVRGNGRGTLREIKRISGMEKEWREREREEDTDGIEAILGRKRRVEERKVRVEKITLKLLEKDYKYQMK